MFCKENLEGIDKVTDQIGFSCRMSQRNILCIQQRERWKVACWSTRNDFTAVVNFHFIWCCGTWLCNYIQWWSHITRRRLNLPENKCTRNKQTVSVSHTKPCTELHIADVQRKWTNSRRTRAQDDARQAHGPCSTRVRAGPAVRRYSEKSTGAPRTLDSPIVSHARHHLAVMWR